MINISGKQLLDTDYKGKIITDDLHNMYRQYILIDNDNASICKCINTCYDDFYNIYKGTCDGYFLQFLHYYNKSIIHVCVDYSEHIEDFTYFIACENAMDYMVLKDVIYLLSGIHDYMYNSIVK